MKKILLTGASGTIGTALRNQLGHKYHFCCVDIEPTSGEEDVVVGNITNFKEILSSMKGMDAIVHLAANPNDAQSWEDVFHDGIGGTYNIFEAAHQSGINKVIYASSIQVHGKKTRLQTEKISSDRPTEPDNLYGVGKSIGEMLARYFSEKYEMSIICLRIGSFYRDPPYPTNVNDEILKSWCSPEDLAQLVSNCLESDDLGFQVFYAVSNNTRRIWDIENARKLVNYHPISDAEKMIKPQKNHEAISELLQGHKLLFRAAVLDGDAALENWQRWGDQYDLEKIDIDICTIRLLPIIYFNLAKQGIEHPITTKLKGIYRQTWVENQLALKGIIPFIQSLQKDNTPVALLDDGTSILQLYDGQGVRRLNSLDLLARPNDIPPILKTLREQAIWPKVGNGERYLRVETPLEIWSPFPQAISLAWRVTSRIKSPEQALAHWQNVQAYQLGDCPVFTLDLEPHFIRSCINVSQRNPKEGFFFLVDAAWMLIKRSGDINWTEVAELIENYHSALPVRDCLRRLKTIIDVPTLDKLLERIGDIPVSIIDRLEYHWVIEYHPYPGFFHRIMRRLVRYLISPKIPGPLGLIRYFQYAWGGSGLLSVPRLILKHIIDLILPSWRRKI